MTDILYFNISEMKLSITSLYIISVAPKYDIIWTENSDVIDSFIEEILKYAPVSLRPGAKDLDREIHTEYLQNSSHIAPSMGKTIYIP